MEAKLIKTRKEYRAAMKEILRLAALNPVEGTKESDDLELLSLIIANYEDKHFPIPPVDPIEAIKFRMDQMGVDRAALAKMIGGRSRVSEIFSGKRKISPAMAKSLNQKLHVPAETLIRAMA